MIIEDTMNPTATLDALAQAEAEERMRARVKALNDSIKKFGETAEETSEAVKELNETLPDTRLRIPWGEGLAALQRRLKQMRHADDNFHTGLAPSHWVMVKLAKKRRKKIASASRRRNYA